MHYYKFIIFFKCLSTFIITCLLIGCKVPIQSQKAYHLSRVTTDSLFQSKQRIHLLTIKNNSDYLIDIGYNKSTLSKTSDIAKNNNAVAAINGSFFDIENGMSTTYLEKNNEVISKTKKINSLINGIILLENKEIKIDTFKNDQFYKNSKSESFAIATGPLLLKNSILQKLPKKNFTITKHPRTCICKKKDTIIFIVVDGRNKNASGMNLFETQKYLLSLGCIDAINLDGGGSSLMWIKNKGIVNTPSDINGERAVSNALLLIEKN